VRSRAATDLNGRPEGYAPTRYREVVLTRFKIDY
jgi:hypothetical protein